MRQKVRGQRRAFLKLLGMAGAGAATAWKWFMPEARAMGTSGTPDPSSTPTSTPSVSDPTNLSVDEIADLAVEADSSPDVARLLARLPGPTVAGTPIAGQRLVENDVEYSFVAIPHAPTTAPDVVVAYIVFGTMRGLSGAAQGYVLPAAFASYDDGSAYGAAEGQIARFRDPAVEAKVFDEFWDAPVPAAPVLPSSFHGWAPAHARSREGTMPAHGFRHVREADETCDDPRVKDCAALCRGACAYAGIWNGVRCGLMVLLCAGVIITTGPMPGIVTCSVMVLVCGTTIAIERGCSQCRYYCREYNRAVCADARRNRGA